MAAAEGIITSLVVRRGPSDRIVVFVDGSRVLELAAVLADRAGLRVGEPLSAEKRASLELADEPYRARSRALRLLAMSDRLSGEVGERLRVLGFSPAVVASTLSWLSDLGYLEDRRYVERYVSERLAVGWGEQRIRSELLRKGADRSLVDQFLESASADSGSAALRNEALVSALRARFGRQFGVDSRRAEQKVAGFLARRGHDWETIERVTRKLREEAKREADPETDLE